MKIFNRTNNKGFTIIELMIAVAIIGILAAIAVPAYSNYTAKARIAAAIKAASSLETAVSECFHITGNISSCQGGTNGIPGGPIALGNDINAAVANGFIAFNITQLDITIFLTPTVESSGSLSWRCLAMGSVGNTVNTAQLPTNCTTTEQPPLP